MGNRSPWPDRRGLDRHLMQRRVDGLADHLNAQPVEIPSSLVAKTQQLFAVARRMRG